MTFDAHPVTRSIEDEIAALLTAGPPDNRAATLYAPGQAVLRKHFTAVAFVLDDMADWQTLAAAVPAGAVDAVHLLSHGALGSFTLDADSALTRQDDLARLGQALNAGGDILLYGCDAAQGDDGRALLQTLAAPTQADVAASTDVTGSAALGGNWQLEAASGPVQASSADFAAGLAQYGHLLVSIANHTTVDFDGVGTSGGRNPLSNFANNNFHFLF